MTQYNNPGFGQYPAQPYVEQRTSVMAVLSLVFSLICCLPGPSLLGALLGVMALIAIGRSNDRLVGRGLAIAGIIIGLVISAIWLGIFVGGGKLYQTYQTDFATPISTKIEALDKGDYTTARTLFTTEANARITDADLDALRAGYQAELGSFVGAPKTLGALLKAASEGAPALEAAQGRNDIIPLVVTFDNGPGVVLLQIDPSAAQSGTMPQFVNIMVASPKGTKWTLWDPARLPPGTPTPPPLPDAPAPADPNTSPSTPPESPEQP